MFKHNLSRLTILNFILLEIKVLINENKGDGLLPIDALLSPI